jgi:hypothetical protein
MFFWIFTIAATCITTLFTLAIIEQKASIYGYVAPSVALSRFAKASIQFFLLLGKYFAIVCSFLLQIKKYAMEYLKDLLPHLLSILIPMGEIIISPIYFVEGYARHAWELLKSSTPSFGTASSPKVAVIETIDDGSNETIRRRGRPKAKVAGVESGNDEYVFNVILLVGGTLCVFAVLGTIIYYCLSFE